MAVRLSKTKKPVMPFGSLSVIKPPKVVKGDEATTALASADTKVKDVASVVVTIASGGSYDQLFRNLPQQSEYGRIAVYLMEPGEIMVWIQKALNGESLADAKTSSGAKIAPEQIKLLEKLRDNCEEAGSEAVCFNFECCSGCSEAGFSESHKNVYMSFIEFLVKDYSCMTMFSDFSLKALINDWDESKLGPAAFRNVGSFSGNFELAFNCEKLKSCPSAQLNTVGTLSEEKNGLGTAKLHAMSGTIAFTITEETRQIAVETDQTLEIQNKIDPMERKYIEPYEASVLTTATMLCAPAFTATKIQEVTADEGLAVCEIGSARGLAGHVLLTYPPSARSMKRFVKDREEEEAAKAKALADKVITSDVADDPSEQSPARGMILASCGHWIELLKLDVNMKRLLNTVQEEWGADTPVYQNMATTFAGMAPAMQAASAQSNAVSYMQSRAPAKFNQQLMRKKKKGY